MDRTVENPQTLGLVGDEREDNNDTGQCLGQYFVLRFTEPEGCFVDA